MRERIKNALNDALKARDQRRVATLRLILVAIKDREIAARATGGGEGPGEREILEILQKMIRQREEAIHLYEQAGRPELAEQEREEIAIIREFMPAQMSDEDIRSACRAVVEETGAKGLNDMGRIMAALRQRYAGRMDFGKASGMVRSMLAE